MANEKYINDFIPRGYHAITCSASAQQMGEGVKSLAREEGHVHVKHHAHWYDLARNFAREKGLPLEEVKEQARVAYLFFGFVLDRGKPVLKEYMAQVAAKLAADREKGFTTIDSLTDKSPFEAFRIIPKHGLSVGSQERNTILRLGTVLQAAERYPVLFSKAAETGILPERNH